MPGIAEQHLEPRARRRVAPEDRLDILAQALEHGPCLLYAPSVSCAATIATLGLDAATSVRRYALPPPIARSRASAEYKWRRGGSIDGRRGCRPRSRRGDRRRVGRRRQQALERNMPEVIFNGSDGRLEGRYVHGEGPTPPLALILHPHPQHGGTMNNRIVYSMFHMFAAAGLLGAALQLPRRRPLAGRVRPRPGRAARRGRGAGLDAAAQPEQHAAAGWPASRSAPGSPCSC